ncbi:hypothetical protein ACLOJK_040172 [Asimina triloba]
MSLAGRGAAKFLAQVELKEVFLLWQYGVLLFQSLALTYGHALSSLFPAVKVPMLIAKGSHMSEDSSQKSPAISELTFMNDSVTSKEMPVAIGVVKSSEDSNSTQRTEENSESNEDGGDPDSEFALENDEEPDLFLEEDGNPDDELSHEKAMDQVNGLMLEKVNGMGNSLNSGQAEDEEGRISLDKDRKSADAFASDNIRNSDGFLLSEKNNASSLASPQEALSSMVSNTNEAVNSDGSTYNSIVSATSSIPSTSKQASEMLRNGTNSESVQNDAPVGDSSVIPIVPTRKNMRQTFPYVPVSMMDRILERNRVSSRSMVRIVTQQSRKPRWSSVHDQELLYAKKEIQNAPILKNDPELHAPVFRNVSMFKRSYELMENMLKVYVYKEGGRPIFHTPMLRGIYASEGWFMKQMEGNKKFAVKDPRKAHLFYLPFSSRSLQYKLYVPGSHNRRNLAAHLKNYVENIAAKYPFWNRTGGADHFLAACHDWAPYETRRTLDHTIRALCNSDLNEGFKIGKDVALPETFVRNQQNPLKDLGGKPASKRPILAFFAGNLHGKVRPILLKYWESKDPDMKILGPMPHGPKRKMAYAQYMKNSKYCICPRGYEVNSPRVVEAIFYECVPVIISDNFVPPFFEILNWESFAVFVAEKDIPMLKDILLSIREKKYRAMQMRVKKVQQHFLWHTRPVKLNPDNTCIVGGGKTAPRIKSIRYTHGFVFLAADNPQTISIKVFLLGSGEARNGKGKQKYRVRKLSSLPACLCMERHVAMAVEDRHEIQSSMDFSRRRIVRSVLLDERWTLFFFGAAVFSETPIDLGRAHNAFAGGSYASRVVFSLPPPIGCGPHKPASTKITPRGLRETVTAETDRRTGSSKFATTAEPEHSSPSALTCDGHLAPASSFSHSLPKGPKHEELQPRAKSCMRGVQGGSREVRVHRSHASRLPFPRESRKLSTFAFSSARAENPMRQVKHHVICTCAAIRACRRAARRNVFLLPFTPRNESVGPAVGGVSVTTSFSSDFVSFSLDLFSPSLVDGKDKEALKNRQVTSRGLGVDRRVPVQKKKELDNDDWVRSDERNRFLGFQSHPSFPFLLSFSFSFSFSFFFLRWLSRLHLDLSCNLIPIRVCRLFLGRATSTLDSCLGESLAFGNLDDQTHLWEKSILKNEFLPSMQLMLPLFGFRLAWKVAFTCFEISSIHMSHIQMRVQSFISRVHRTLHGSSDDIGWLQQTPGFAPVQDGTTRFMELLDHIRYHSITIIPASVERNAWELKQYIDELYWGSGKRVLLLGHSKGGVDAAAALSLYWSVLKDKVAGLALVQSPYGGTPIASDILREGQIADKEARRIMEFLICKLIKGDIRALEDLTYEKRKEFVTKHKLPEQVPIVSFHSEASIAPGVLATMSHIAHAELPWLSLPSFGHEELDSCQAGHKLPVIIPLAAAMAVCALHLRLRYGEKSDGVVTCRDAEVPGSVVVRPDRKLDHAWMVYSSWKKEADEPDASEMCEALLTLLVEIGKMKQKNIQGDGW